MHSSSIVSIKSLESALSSSSSLSSTSYDCDKSDWEDEEDDESSQSEMRTMSQGSSPSSTLLVFSFCCSCSYCFCCCDQAVFRCSLPDLPRSGVWVASVQGQCSLLSWCICYAFARAPVRPSAKGRDVRPSISRSCGGRRGTPNPLALSTFLVLMAIHWRHTIVDGGPMQAM